ncbi:MAG: hypothetical protein IPP57_18070 [Candidatus Obscuribacter sp.]|nr:hypothetical protein [Candidatus Obscuribacter sp.]
MTWKEHATAAMKALINGDNATAIANWKTSIALIVENKEQGTAEIAQIYYYLGKCLADDGELVDGIEAMSQAEAIFGEVEPGHATVKDLKYHLGAALNKVGDHGAADSRLRSAMGIVDAPLAKGLIRQKNSNLTIKEMVKVLKNTGLVNELSPALLKKLRTQLKKKEGVKPMTSTISIHLMCSIITGARQIDLNKTVPCWLNALMHRQIYQS